MAYQEITFTRAAWTEHVENKLRPALQNDLMLVKSLVFNKEAALFSINDGESYLVVKVSCGYLVVIAYAGTRLLEACPYIIAEAKRKGLWVRFHTTNPALIRMVRRFCPEPIEYVMRVNPNGNV